MTPDKQTGNTGSGDGSQSSVGLHGASGFSGLKPKLTYYRVNRAHHPQRRARRKIGRNDPCPCGSGRKFKVCHAYLVA